MSDVLSGLGNFNFNLAEAFECKNFLNMKVRLKELYLQRRWMHTEYDAYLNGYFKKHTCDIFYNK